MSFGSKTVSRVLAVVMAILAVALTIRIVLDALTMDDGGPPLGTIFVAMPAVALLIAAGIVWSAAIGTSV